jgi:anti-sigma regulatory factor (Ser/Thr protein kinase)
MQAHQQASTNGHAPDAAEPLNEPIDLRAAYLRQAQVIDTLTEAITRLRIGATALKADNTDLRGELDRLREPRGVAEPAELADIRLAIDERAPALARTVLAGTLSGRVPPLVLEQAQLLTSELVTNSVLHCGASGDDALVFRVKLSSTSVRLEVEDPGQGAPIAPRAPDAGRCHGFGLNIVDTLSASWGVERLSAGTRVWAQLTVDT